MPEKPLIVLDFDRVLFDTDGYLASLCEAAQRFGITREGWQSAYRKRPAGSVFTFQSIADNLAKKFDVDAAELVAAMKEETADAVWFLFADARPFLERLHEIADVYLLTFGSAIEQEAKIDGTGIRHFFKDIAITEESKSANRQLPISSVSQAIFLNDSVSEMLELGGLYRWSYHLHINRAGSDVPPNFPFQSFGSLREAEPAVLSLVDTQTAGQVTDPVADQRGYAA